MNVNAGIRLCVTGASLLALCTPGLAQTTTPLDDPATASEEVIIETINRLVEPSPPLHAEPTRPARRLERQRRIVALVDALLLRFPESSYRQQALVNKLTALAKLARTRPEYLRELLLLTEKIGQESPEGELASENAYFAIQAFVLGARYEDMPEKRRLRGTLERYDAFLKDYPESKRRPVIWASLIRNLIALESIERARSELAKLRQAFPDHKATRRAAGEVNRATAVGRPFGFEYTTPGGKEVRSRDYLGRVLLVHFWATWSKDSLAGLDELTRLHKEYNQRGLELIGINVDTDPVRFAMALRRHKMPWPQYFDEKGLENDVLVGAGVVGIPTIFVIDRAGICRSTDPGDTLGELVERLLNEPGLQEGS